MLGVHDGGTVELMFFLNIFLENFLFFLILYSARLHLPPLRFHCANRCWDRTQDRCNSCIGSQNALTTRLDLMLMFMFNIIFVAQPLFLSFQPHTNPCCSAGGPLYSVTIGECGNAQKITRCKSIRPPRSD
jgi:hypothetical protein